MQPNEDSVGEGDFTEQLSPLIVCFKKSSSSLSLLFKNKEVWLAQNHKKNMGVVG